MVIDTGIITLYSSKIARFPELARVKKTQCCCLYSQKEGEGGGNAIVVGY